MLKFKIGPGSIPAGNYVATFAGVEEVPADAAKGFGPGVRWRFKVTAGPQAGQVASRVTGPVPSPKNAAGKLLSGILGRAVREGEEVDLQAHVGKPYLVVVGGSPQGGGTRVESVLPMPSTPPAGSA